MLRAFIVSVLILSFWLLSSTGLTRAQDIITVDDATQGPGSGQFNYTGLNWKHCTKCGQDVGVYNLTNSWDTATNEYVTVVFTGTQIAFYGVLGTANGIGAFSIDSGPESMVDFYGEKTEGDHLLWTSPALSPARHVLRIRVTGSKNEASTGAYVSLDRVDITPGPTDLTGTPPAVTEGSQPLLYPITNAAYSQSLDRIIMISSVPSALHIYNPLTADDISVSLLRPPLALGLSPDGKFAAVAQNGLAAYIDLESARIVKLVAIAARPTSIALGLNSLAYVMAGKDAFPRLIAVDFSTGLAKQVDNQAFNADLDLKLQPSGTRLYGGSISVSPGYIAAFDISKGEPDSGIQRRLENDYLCGKIFMAQDGSRLFTGQGAVYSLSQIPSRDVQYNGKLTGIIYVRSIFDSSEAGLILAIPESRPTLPCPNHGTETSDRLLVFDYKTLGLLKTLPIPSRTDDTTPGTGRFVFVSADGLKYFLIVQSDKRAGSTAEFAILVGDIESLH